MKLKSIRNFSSYIANRQPDKHSLAKTTDLLGGGTITGPSLLTPSASVCPAGPTHCSDLRRSPLGGVSISPRTTLSDQQYQQLALDTLEELDWCLDQLETIQTHRSVSEMASNKVRKAHCVGLRVTPKCVSSSSRTEEKLIEHCRLMLLS